MLLILGYIRLKKTFWIIPDRQLPNQEKPVYQNKIRTIPYQRNLSTSL